MQTIYHRLLKTWCDGMLRRQVTNMGDRRLDGGLLCPACVLIHGRCADAVPPMLHQAKLSGDHCYLDAAIAMQAWVENVTKPDGSWMNDVNRGWQGITVFGAMALCESLVHYGDMLDASVRSRWTERLRLATKWIYDTIRDVDFSNINYPISAGAAMALTGRFLDDKNYLARAKALTYESLEFISDNGLIIGEGQPLREPSAKGCRPIDVCYNAEESLGALALYGLEMGDEAVLQTASSSLRAHLAFMMPDGGWDASWSTRNFKWTYWGSRTSDGVQTACALLADRDPLFAQAAYRNAQLYERCTHDGLLYGGPDLHHRQ